ncbi:SRPBCC family protein [Nocardia africana]|uniref:Activator of Hsp90 ATPase homolog 1-like protein n=1 Tax=Nocardia africana TaxID=134964 RepID=A0A378X5G1_9NOCA|nr:SRPBCC family protein [Nocardia africana]MCC3317632.1 SRPBCC family protein [Nocardia africana]SUA48392.1 Activator of Hsp90 ATPase homolog 1-like protein [Nocardia africana]
MTTTHSLVHSTFTLERDYPVTPATVFGAWAEPERKAEWFSAPGTEHELDFRVGGREIAAGMHDGKRMTFTTTYQEIVPGERIVYTSTMGVDDAVVTVSLTTVEFAETAVGTRLTLTEHGAYLDDHEKPEWREHGTSEQLATLEQRLQEMSSR